MVKLYHTAALFKRHLPSNLIRQFAQLLADAFGIFLVIMHDTAPYIRINILPPTTCSAI
jgi:hypothetical protein